MMPKGNKVSIDGRSVKLTESKINPLTAGTHIVVASVASVVLILLKEIRFEQGSRLYFRYICTNSHLHKRRDAVR